MANIKSHLETASMLLQLEQVSERERENEGEKLKHGNGKSE